MYKLIQYMLLGVATMASAEFQGNVLLRGNIVNFFLAMAVYAVISLVAYLIGKRARNDLWFYVGGGLFGLLVIEWWLVGFYPGSGKAGIHVAMFTNWAAVFTVPRVFASGRTDPSVRSRVKWAILVYSLVAPLLVLALPIPRGGTVAILMSIYSITLSFVFVPFLTHSSASARRMRIVLWLGVVAAMVNILLW
jgi:hypothetical protein